MNDDSYMFYDFEIIHSVKHDLTLLITEKYLKLLEKSNLINHRYAVMDKCFKLWVKLNNFNENELKTCENIKIDYPDPIRFFKLFNSLDQTVFYGEKLNIVVKKLNLNIHFEESDFCYLKELTAFLKIVSLAIAKLENDDQSHYGSIIPILSSLHTKLKNFEKDNRFLNYVLINEFLIIYEERFRKFLRFTETRAKDSVLAASFHPSYKLRWAPEELDNSIKDICIEEFKSNNLVTEINIAENNSEQDDFIILRDKETVSSNASQIQLISF